MNVAALFIDRSGPYPNLAGVDCWDESRDARRYPGTRPVVAHPPCHLWTNFAALNFKRYGGDHNRPGFDGGCFASAYLNTLRHGGVLEHPASSNAWSFYSLPRPRAGGGGWSGGPRAWTCEVWQSAYGHLARKRTWLFYCGDQPPIEADWRRAPGTHQCGWFDRLKPTLGKKEASRTPIAFARFLVALARHSCTQRGRASA